MEFLTRNVSNYLPKTPSYVLSCTPDGIENSLKILSYHNDRDQAEKAKRQHLRNHLIQTCYHYPDQTGRNTIIDLVLDQILSQSTIGDNENEVLKNILDILGLNDPAEAPDVNPTSIPVLRYDQIFNHLTRVLVSESDFQSDFNLLMDTLNFQSTKETQIFLDILDILNQTTVRNLKPMYHISEMPSIPKDFFKNHQSN